MLLMDKRDSESPAAKLRIIKYLDGDDQPYTAFVALDDDQWADVIAEGNGDLSAYPNQVIYVSHGHAPYEDEKFGARQAFAQMYGSRHTGYSGRGTVEPSDATDAVE